MACEFERRATAPDSGLCRGCETPLKRNRDGTVSKVRRWCSTDCAREVSRNHSWGDARYWAVYLNSGKRSLHPPGPCAHCKQPIKGTPEVNHIAPRYGKGYGTGCWNHQSNLEVLCHDCHVAVTRKQRAARDRGGQIGFLTD